VRVLITNKLDNCSANKRYIFEFDVELVLFGKLLGRITSHVLFDKMPFQSRVDDLM
jgi:hypothetical protein